MILDGLTPEEMQAVEKLATVSVYKQGSLIIEEGKAGTTFFLLRSGRVEIRKRDRRLQPDHGAPRHSQR